MSNRQNIQVAVDAVVFGYGSRRRVSILLIQRKYQPFKDMWALPGGFVRSGETLENAVERELKEEAGISINYLEQLYTFAKPDRDPRMRIISIAYFGLVKPEVFQLSASSDASDAEWFPIDELPPLAFDHDEIIRVAIDRLRAKLSYEPVGFELLDTKFPFSDLENLYSSLLGKEIDRRNFRKKILSFGLLEELEETYSSGAGRPARLFRFNKEKYFTLKKSGFFFEI